MALFASMSPDTKARRRRAARLTGIHPGWLFVGPPTTFFLLAFCYALVLSSPNEELCEHIRAVQGEAGLTAMGIMYAHPWLGLLLGTVLGLFVSGIDKRWLRGLLADSERVEGLAAALQADGREGRKRWRRCWSPGVRILTLLGGLLALVGAALALRVSLVGACAGFVGCLVIRHPELRKLYREVLARLPAADRDRLARHVRMQLIGYALPLGFIALVFIWIAIACLVDYFFVS